jgi:hypothetical protein
MSDFQKQRFDELMTDAQVAYGEGNLQAASGLYSTAYDVAVQDRPPDWPDVTRAARGVFEATYRLDPNADDLSRWRQATVQASDNVVEGIVGRQAWTIADLKDLNPAQLKNAREPLRELIQTHTILGKVVLRQMISKELQTGTVSDAEKNSMFYSLRLASNMLPYVEGKDGPIDQYRINLQCPWFYAERLYGLRDTSLRIAAQAVRDCRLSESPALPTAANISDGHRRESRQRAEKRALSMIGSSVVPRPVVLRIARRVV